MFAKKQPSETAITEAISDDATKTAHHLIDLATP
jgi:hypothetical protein